ncbi:MAG: DUF4423 domain-containing protein [Bdellovibrionaceae bacterium]|nr:DUF4423 domain-containing protein [Pseudobdellovibrionaceae bacterium]
MDSIRSLEKDQAQNLHYSSVVSISKKDVANIQEKLIEVLAEIKPIIRKSKEEDIYSLSMDFFSL